MNRKLLRIALAHKGVPQIAVARLLGVDNGTFSRWARGWYQVPVRYRAQLAGILEVSEEELFPVQKNAEVTNG